jgi:hypothetical protein
MSTDSNFKNLFFVALLLFSFSIEIAFAQQTTVQIKPCPDLPGDPPEWFSYCSGNAPISIPLSIEGLGTFTLTYNSQVMPEEELESDSIDIGFGPRWSFSPFGSRILGANTTTGVSNKLQLIDASGYCPASAESEHF